MLQNPDTEIVLVEAEKSALALTAWAERRRRESSLLGWVAAGDGEGESARTLTLPASAFDVFGVLPDLSAMRRPHGLYLPGRECGDKLQSAGSKGHTRARATQARLQGVDL